MTTTNKWLKIQTVYGLGFALLWTVLAALGAITHHGMMWWPTPGIGMGVVTVGMLKWTQWMYRGDVVWLSRIISQALTMRANESGESPQKKDWLKAEFTEFIG